MSILVHDLVRLWTGVAVHLWQTSLVLAVVFLLARGMRSAPARGTQALWTAAFIKILLPVAIFGGPIAALADRGGIMRGMEGFTLEPVRAVLNPSRLLDPVLLGSARGVEILAMAFTVLWIAGFSVKAGMLARDCIRSARDRGMAIGRLPDRQRARLDRALAGACIPRRAIRISAHASLPYVAGLLEPRILVPMGLLRETEAGELRALLLHEEAHRRRRDPLRAAAMRFCAALLFFYPPAAWVVRRLRESAELVCDEQAVRSGLERDAYARALAGTLRRSLYPIADPLSAGLGGGAGLRIRFERISEPWRYCMRNRHRLILGSALALLVAVTFLPAPLLAGGDGTASSVSGDGADAADTMPVLVQTVPPAYPEAERKNGVEGTVMLRLRVTAKGGVGQILVVEAVPDHPAFNDSAIAAARQWIFEPATKDGKAVACWVQVPIRFALK
jgi:TonB family protein